MIIDTNTLSSVFDKNSSNHEDFKPVLDWITTGNGIVVYGGTKYMRELQKAGKYLKIIRLLSDCRKARHIKDDQVDILEKVIIKKVSPKKFNDAHIVAIVNISKCKIICSCDSTAYPFFKDKSLYEGCIVPKIYCSKKNASLLNDKNIPYQYLSSKKIKKSDIQKINAIIC